MKRSFFLLCTAAVIVACSTKKEQIPYAETETIAEATVQGAAMPEPDRKIVRDGRMNVEVRDVHRGKAAIDALAAKYDAYYSNEAFNEYRSRLTCELTLRVPSASFDALTSAIEASAELEVTSKRVDAEDVTDRFVDIETRLGNKRSYLARYRELLARANTIDEILKIEAQIRPLEEEIESAEGRLKLLTDQTSFSTLTILVEQPVAATASFRSKVGDALGGGWTGLVKVFVALLYIWPLLILLIVGLTLALRKRKR